MADAKDISVNTSIGKHKVDHAGSPVGVVRMETSKSYSGIGELLKSYIDKSDELAWETIRAKIDYTYENLDLALSPLNAESGFGREIKSRIHKGQKLLFKPNLVNVFNIDPQTHGPGPGSTTCTEWPFLAALMRWFHDKLDISYHEMALGEAATMMPAASGLLTIMNDEDRQVTTEAAIEGRAGNLYGGWGFYFVRKYLAQSHDSSHSDHPMRGYEESVAGTFVPPGLARDKLMVYDLNQVSDNPAKARNIEVADGVNFKHITLHKAVIGGDPADPEDLRAFPGSILVNVPKLKVHAITLLSNVIKNLGIGLYPMQAAVDSGAPDSRWKYSLPHNALPGIKAGIPHSVWVAEIDPVTGEPKKDDARNYLVKKTGGILATMVDIIKAVSSQGVFMLHIVDAIEIINLDHTGQLPGTREPEGLVVASLDPVAADLLCARYMFSNVPLLEAQKAGLDDGNGGMFPQRVPVPTVQDNNIVTAVGYDCPISRDACFRYAEERGLGTRRYHALGRDRLTDADIVSLQGHLGTVGDGRFVDLNTRTLYFDASKVPWDLQLTALSYLGAVDRLAGSSLKKEFLAAFDENDDGVISYEEFGKNGFIGSLLAVMGDMDSIMGREKLGVHSGSFMYNSTILRLSNPMWNSEGPALLQYFSYGPVTLIAYIMSQMETEQSDPFFSGLTWGKGKWPSYQLAAYVQVGIFLYGAEFPNKIGLRSLYGHAFRYADLTQNDGRYTGKFLFEPAPEGAHKYIDDVLSNQAKPLDFVVYIPPGYGSVGVFSVPNVEETSNPEQVFTATFLGGKEVWANRT